ncbi:Stp1/IreP family PP2C-type Ser/Thr phosphatase [Paenibacillus montanisoli]|uniref:Stp1/IreP family PP2C-type Ser/Thr phosphatase n=1 Tax=Paenibacillus montanisoli TaxID=2081970 RepID=A0A328UDI5_9BACL|nr:Stp1/IreP family PP2C-type Ser/Thr phosphatase [Paenibacillus montanisoli]RAP78126.1 Stp1/IreP family PP2C-type Ser/Thr phosphatase [Paenibacillus montanisoli]
MIIAYRSDVGRVRSVNEDTAWSDSYEFGLTVAIVADGMGGHKAGEVASQLAVDTFREALQHVTAALPLEDRKLLMSQAILQANEVIYDLGSNNEQFHNMGTTVVAALIQDDTSVIGHIGDSRVYKWKDGVLTQLTEDHTLVYELVKSGQITLEEAATHPRRNVITRALGTDEQIEVDIICTSWQAGDMLMLCSDGLVDMASPSSIVETLGREDLNLDQKADRLVQLALEAGGEDNITVILLHHAENTELEG